MRYLVKYPEVVWYSTEVEADSEEEARENAYSSPSEPGDSGGIIEDGTTSDLLFWEVEVIE